jgi:hypothetical protein
MREGRTRNDRYFPFYTVSLMRERAPNGGGGDEWGGREDDEWRRRVS